MPRQRHNGMPWMVNQRHYRPDRCTMVCRDRGTMACHGWLNKGTNGLTEARWHVETEAQRHVVDGPIEAQWPDICTLACRDRGSMVCHGS